MNKGEFERAYAESHQTTVEQLHADGMFGYPVMYCSMDGCDGWHMGNQNTCNMERALADLVARKA